MDPERYRFRAEETRTVADQMTHEEARTIMRRVANDYDRLAKVAEELAMSSIEKMLGWFPHTSREWIELIIMTVLLWLLMMAVFELELSSIS